MEEEEEGAGGERRERERDLKAAVLSRPRIAVPRLNGEQITRARMRAQDGARHTQAYINRTHNNTN